MKRLVPTFAACALLGLLSACATPVEIAPIGEQALSAENTPAQIAAYESVSPRGTHTGWEEIDMAEPAEAAAPPKAGDVLGNGIEVTPTIEAFWRAGLSKDWKLAQSLVPEIRAEIPDDNRFRDYWLSSQMVQYLIHAGQPELAREKIAELSREEMSLFGNNVEALSQLGQLAVWLDEPDAAIGYHAKVLGAAPGWWPPTFYITPPSNTEEMRHLAGSKIRALIGVTVAHLSNQDWQEAVRWGEECRVRTQELIELTEHWLYGLFLPATTHLYEGYAWCLLHLADARAGLTGDLAAGEPVWERALEFFEAAHYRDRELVLAEHRDYIGRSVGARPRIGGRIGPLPEPTADWNPDYAALIQVRAADTEFRESIDLPLPDAGSARLPSTGEESAYEFTVTPELDAATSSFLRGEGKAALGFLDSADQALAARGGAKNETDRIYEWYLSYFRVQVLIQLGRGPDAEAALVASEALELAAFGTNVNTRALRGEAKLWQGRPEAAVQDFVSVVRGLEDWRMPTLFVFWPDVAHNVAMTRAHFRSHLGMAGAMLLTGDHEQAEAWAQAAEDLISEAYYNVHHPLNRQYFFVDPDIYFARGINLGILGAARVVNRRDPDAGTQLFESARAYFEALGFAAGQATVDGFRVRALLDIGRADLAEPAAARAAAFAAENGLADLVWKIEALRGEALLALDRPGEAERAYRAADTAVEAVTGSLSTDESKRRFGIGKEEITRRLIELDIESGNMEALFRDLERGRARAFVDMLANRPIAAGRQPELVSEINALDSDIRAQRLRNTAPGASRGDGLERERQLLARRERLIERLRRRDPELADSLSVGTQTLAAAQRRLGPGDRLAYALPPDGDDRLRFLLVTPSRATVVTGKLTEERLAELNSRIAASGRSLVRSARGEMIHATADRWNLDAAERVRPEPGGPAVDGGTRGAPAEPLDPAEQKAAAEEIGRGLDLSGWGTTGTLYVVPRGSLYFLPWGVLDGKSPVVVLPTGGWIARGASGGRGPLPAAVLGDPDLRGELPQLPGARREAVSVGKAYRVTSLIGADATESALRRSVKGGVDVLHLATHGTFNPYDPMESALFLADPDAERADRLTAAELFEKPLSAKLVVLSACETGLGRLEAGDDFLGLARSFYLGGAVSVVNSLWPVEDAPTQLYMEAFHERARHGDYAGGWLLARDRLRDAGYPPSVYGAFVLGGAGRG
ncbi:MAG: CHAT domain-containing protein [Alphaproteobacteria bacterium]|nr:CHAT domain-containing protein [Alphaproteobacteria bacterium]